MIGLRRWWTAFRAAVPGPFGGTADIITIKGDGNWERPRFRMHACQGRDQVARSAAQGWTVFEAPMPRTFVDAVAKAGEGLVIDVGANTGFYTLLALAVCRRVTVAAYEPFAEVRVRLEANVALNADRDRVQIRPQAISSTNGPRTLFIPDASHGCVETSASLSAAFKGGTGHAVVVEAATLDSLHHDTPKIIVIKIDAESHDLDVLRGATRLLMRHRPVVFLEVLFGADEAGLTQMLQSCGYVDIALSPDSGMVQADTVKHHTDAWNHMWLPKEHVQDYRSASGHKVRGHDSGLSRTQRDV